MPKARWLIAARFLLRSLLPPVAAGWATLIAISYLIERPLLAMTAPELGSHWVATEKLSLDCFALAAAGWVTGRLTARLTGRLTVRMTARLTGQPGRPALLPSILTFAATVVISSCLGFDVWLGIDIPALAQVTAGALHDPRYFEGLETILIRHVFLFGSLIVGGLLSRPPRAHLSLFGRAQ